MSVLFIVILVLLQALAEALIVTTSVSEINLAKNGIGVAGAEAWHVSACESCGSDPKCAC